MEGITIEISQRQLVNLFIDKMRSLGISEKHGVYDKADPTSFTNYKGKVGLMYGFTIIEDPDQREMGCPDNFPEPENVEIKITDCTWGIEFSFKTSKGEEKGYFDSNTGNKADGKFYRTTPDFVHVFRRLFFEGIPEQNWEKEDYSDYDYEGGYIYN